MAKFFDDFNRPDGALGNDWTGSTLSIVGNVAKHTADATDPDSYSYNTRAISGTAEHRVRSLMSHTGGEAVAITWAYTSNVSHYYLRITGGTQLSLRSYFGTRVDLASATVAAGARVVEVRHNFVTGVITVYVDESLIITSSGHAIAQQQYAVGIGAFSTVSNVTHDNFGASTDAQPVPTSYAEAVDANYGSYHAYGTRSYGGGALIQANTPVPVAAAAAGASTVTMGLSVAPASASNLTLYDSTPPSDIVLATTAGPDTFSMVANGAASATASLNQAFNLPATSNGRATVTSGLGEQYSVSSTSAGAASGASTIRTFRGNDADIYVLESSPDPEDINVEARQGPNTEVFNAVSGATVTMGMGRVNPVSSTAVGQAVVSITTLNVFVALVAESRAIATVRAELLIFQAGFDSRIYVYRSQPQGSDVNLARADAPPGRPVLGPYDFSIYSSKPPKQTNDVILSTRYGTGAEAGISMVSSGSATMTQQFATAKNVSSTSNGRATFANNYLGSPFRIESTSAGVAAFANNYLGTPQRITSTSAGRGGARDQFGTAGRWYLGSSTRMVATSNGRAAFANNYMAGRVQFAATSAGQGGGTNYLGSPFRVTSTSAGRAGGTWSLGGPVRLQMTSRGVATWTFGEEYLTFYSNGRAAANSLGIYTGSWYLGSSTRMVARSNGVGSFDIAGIEQIRATSNGVATARLEQYLFKFTAHSGCIAFNVAGGPTYPGLYGNTTRGGVFIYLSSKVYFLNNDPFNDWHSSGPQNSTMRGQSTFTFPYEPVSRADAGCRAFTSYRSDDNPAIFPTSGSSGVPGGVFVYQTGRTGLSQYGQSYSLSNRPQLVHAYLSSKVYYGARINGVGTFELGRVDTIRMNGVGGAATNYLNVPSYDKQQATSNGVATASIYNVGERVWDFTAHGIAAGVFTQQGPVYLYTTSNGRSGPNTADPNGFFHYANVVAGCYPYQKLDPDNVTRTHPGVEIAQDRVQPSLAAFINGIANMTAEIEGVPILRITSNGRAVLSWTATSLRNYYGFTVKAGSYGSLSYPGYPGYFIDAFSSAFVRSGPVFNGRQYGVSIEQFQPRDILIDGVAAADFRQTTNFYRGFTSNGIATMVARDNKVLIYAITNTPRTADAWRMVVNWALEIRSRGRTRFNATMNEPRLFGDLLALFYSVPRPGLPSIDGDPTPEHGQYWPRTIKLPFESVRTPYPAWREYEYYRR